MQSFPYEVLYISTTGATLMDKHGTAVPEKL